MMQPLFEVRLLPTVSGTIPHLLSQGSNILGRGTKLNISDVRISRKQLEIVVDSTNKTCTATAHGVNPSYITRAGASERITLRASASAPLNDGDSITLGNPNSNSCYIYTLQILDNEAALPGTDDNDIATQAMDTDPTEDHFVNKEDRQLFHTPRSSPRKRKLHAMMKGTTSNELSDSSPGLNLLDSPSFSKEDAPVLKKKKSSLRPKVLFSENSSESENSQIQRALIESSHGAKIELKDLEMIRTIGTGSYGEVHEASWQGTRVAVKKFFRSLVHKDAVKEFRSECRILGALRHPNVVLYIGTGEIDATHMCIVTEFMCRGSLRDVLNDQSVSITWDLFLKIATQAANGVNYLHLHSPPIIHRDLKSHNLLCDSQFNVKVTDFGLAKLLNSTEDTAKTFCGTMPWTAPELFAAVIQYSTKVDVYSYAIVIWELITRQEPYKNIQAPQIMLKVLQEGLRPEIPEGTPPDLVEFLKTCWATNPADRPTFTEIIQKLSNLAEPTNDFFPKSDLCGLSISTASTSPSSHRRASPQLLTMTNNTSPTTARPPSPSNNNNQVSAISAWELNPEEFALNWDSLPTPVGKGAFSVVYKTTYRGQAVAVKSLFKSKLDEADSAKNAEFFKELEILREMRCPKIVLFYGVIIKPQLCLVTEYMAKGSLYDIMSNRTTKFSWNFVFKLAIEAANAIRALHEWKPSILHRDLKSPNVLVDSNWNVKLADFGQARFKTTSNDETLAKLRGTYAYAAPEVYAAKPYTVKSDVFSFGVILWELVSRNLSGTYVKPYQEYPNLKHDFQIIIQTAKKGLRPTIPKGVPKKLGEGLIQRCWSEDPDKRPEICEVVRTLEELDAECKKRRRGADLAASKNSPNLKSGV